MSSEHSAWKPYAGRPTSARRKWAVLILALIVVLAIAGAALLIKVRHDNKVAAEHSASKRASARAEAAVQEQSKKRADARAAKRAFDERKREARRLLVKELQKSVTKDARKSVGQGLLDGPTFNTQCTPVGGGSTDDLTALTGKFGWLAVSKRKL